MFACDHFEVYIYGRDNVHVETDHKPLESIVLKPLNSAPKRLQRKPLVLEKYSLQVKYKKGEKMFLADTLSPVYLSESMDDHTRSFAVSDDHLVEILCYKCYAKRFGVAGRSPSQMCLRLYIHTSTSEMN